MAHEGIDDPLVDARRSEVRREAMPVRVKPQLVPVLGPIEAPRRCSGRQKYRLACPLSNGSSVVSSRTQHEFVPSGVELSEASSSCWRSGCSSICRWHFPAWCGTVCGCVRSESFSPGRRQSSAAATAPPGGCPCKPGLRAARSSCRAWRFSERWRESRRPPGATDERIPELELLLFGEAASLLDLLDFGHRFEAVPVMLGFE